MTTNIDAAKVRLVYSPVALPAVCANCNFSADGKRKFIDFGLSIDYYGAVYFCESCIVEVAAVMGMIHAAVAERQFEEYENTINVLHVQNSSLQEQVDRYQNAFDAIGFLRADVADRDSVHSVDGETVESNNPGFKKN